MIKKYVFLRDKVCKEEKYTYLCTAIEKRRFSFNPGEMGEWLKPTVC